jgi:exonuclease SbcD
MTGPLRLLQLSDIHFGARLTGGRLGLSEEAARRREEERRDAFTRAMALVVERDLDGVLLPGDLFDDEAVTTDTLAFVLDAFARIAPKPVFLAPGNHDPYGGASPYNPTARGATRGLSWPDNVVLFAHEEFRTVAWPGRPDVTVTGCGVAANVASGERRLSSLIRRPPARLSVLLFHGSRDDGGWLQPHKATHPFTHEEVLEQGFSWTAVGHYHGFQVLDDEMGQPVGAYAGCLLAGGLDETGHKGCLVVTIGDGPALVEHVALDRREVRAARCDLTGCRFAEQARERAQRALAEVGAGPQDLVLLEVTGRRAPGLELAAVRALADEFGSSGGHLRVDLSALQPDVDLESYPPLEQAITTEQRFVAHLREAVATQGEAGRTARRALLYGLDVLTRGRVDARYEE